jgi:hypothetical protein
MQEYVVLRRSPEDLRAVRKGFSFAALFFGMFWLAYKKMWTYALSLFATVTVLSFAKPIIHNTIFTFIQFGIAFSVGVYGKSWFVASLEEKGYEKVWEGEASDLTAAKEKSKLVEDRDILPEYIDCPHCLEELILEEDEREEDILFCPICEKQIDANKLMAQFEQP